ncbi:trypsin-like peptidase domain-containing protein [Shewanella algae]|uniref:trypsin-like peptidase domain-containing protein n=1 Tax=Shewanella algae TaxID=38313 RepID=UPI001AAE871B|nr:trypsin-like peptidase domain-containing protein [Shewanella algae]MBO2591753.1 trypsin-like peptidase domain-containing protein [Shewanella algae]
MSINKKFPVHNALVENASIYCATIAISPNFTQDLYASRESDVYDSATVTFFKYEGKFYGVTCWHVVEILQEAERTNGKGTHSFHTMLNGFYTIGNRFYQPTAKFGQPRPDIAIREVLGDFINHLGKTPIDVENIVAPSEVPDFAYAVGFPTKLKYSKEVREDFINKKQVVMPHIQVLAEITNQNIKQRFTMHSESTEDLDVKSFSGTSGGPIFWSNNDEYGLIGIIYESITGTMLASDKTIHISAECANKDEVIRWITEYEAQK